jgi:hypothetical protein
MAIQDNLQDIQHIRKMMEQSSRFISLSGKSGIAAGIAALLGAFLANHSIQSFLAGMDTDYVQSSVLQYKLMGIAAVTFILALIGAFYFTYTKSKQDGTPIFSIGSRKLAWNTLLPMLVGGLVILVFIIKNDYEYIAPASLIFYGLGVINGSKYTLGEVKYIGYTVIVLGLINFIIPQYSILLWALGFGVTHIIYGIAMWRKYDSK